MFATIKSTAELLWSRKERYMPWEEYAELTTAIDNYLFTQQTREENVANIPAIGS